MDIFYKNEKDIDKLHLFEFEPKIIKEIYFGLRSDLDNRKEIIKIIQSNSEYKDVKFFQIELYKKEFKLIPKTLNI